MATFKHFYKNDTLIGTGTYKFRPYTVLTPTVSLTTTLTGCTMSPTVTSINRLGETTVTFVASTNYQLPTSVQVTGATAVSWDQTTGKLVIEKATADTVNVKVTATKIVYSITTNLTNVTKSSGPSSIESGGSATLVFVAADNYELPDSVTVAGATSNWTQSTGTLVLSDATGNVTVGITGVYLLKVISAGAYTFKDAPSVTATHAQFAFTTNNATGSGITVDSTGITYILASPLGSTKVYTAATTNWTLSAYKILVLSAEAHVTEAFYTWWTANILEKLATPTNVSITGTTLSWDAVENAESYDILADGVVIGNTTVTYTITTTVTNGTYTGDTSIAADGTASITITANDGYTLPDEVTVTGATGAWNKTTGTLSISNPTGNATVTAECVAVQTGETWVLNKTVDWSTITPDSDLKFMNVSYYPLISVYEYGDITIGNFTFTVEDADLENHVVMFKITDDYSVAYNRYTSSGWYAESNSEVFVSNDNALKLRTFVFSTPPTGDLLTWLQANGTKREAFILPTIARLVDASNYDLAQDTIFVTSTAKTAIEKINNEENFGLSDFIQMFLDNTVDESKKVSLEEVQEKISEKLLAYAFAARFVANTTITPDVDGYYPIDIECETLKNNDSAFDVVVLCYNYVSDEFEVREPRNIVIETGIVSTEISDYKGEILTAIVYSDGGSNSN